MERVFSQYHGFYCANVQDDFEGFNSNNDYEIYIKKLSQQVVSNEDMPLNIDTEKLQIEQAHKLNESKLDESVLNESNQQKKSGTSKFGSTKSFRTFENQMKKTQKGKGSNNNSSIVHSQQRQFSQNDQLKESLQFRVLVPSKNPYCKFSEFQNSLSLMGNEVWYRSRLAVIEFCRLNFLYVPNLDINVPCYVTYKDNNNKDSEKFLNVMAFNPMLNDMIKCFSGLNKQAFFDKLRTAKREYSDNTLKIVVLPQMPVPYSTDDSCTKCFFIGITKD